MLELSSNPLKEYTKLLMRMDLEKNVSLPFPKKLNYQLTASFFIQCSVSHCYYVNIKSKCKLLRDLGERSSEGLAECLR